MYLRKIGGLRRTNRGEAVSGSGGGGVSLSIKNEGVKVTHTNQGIGQLKSMSWTCMGTFFALQEDFSLADIHVDERWRILSKQNIA